MRVGLFGGSFDPPHRGHLAVAEAVRDRFALDRVLLAPAAIQPLKPGGAQASFADRLRMVELLCEGAHGIEASTIDAPQPGGSPNYTIDTLHRLRDALPQAQKSSSSSAPMRSSHTTVEGSSRLLKQARWIVVSRPGFDLHQFETLQLTAEQRARIDTLTDFENPVSATEIRERLRRPRNRRRAGTTKGSGVHPRTPPLWNLSQKALEFATLVDEEF